MNIPNSVMEDALNAGFKKHKDGYITHCGFYVTVELLKFAELTLARNSVPQHLYEVIQGVIKRYRMSNMIDSEYGDGYPLVDLMTNDGLDISDGIEEAEYLTDAIWRAITASPQPNTENAE